MFYDNQVTKPNFVLHQCLVFPGGHSTKISPWRMGLLTDPGAGHGKLTQLLVTYHNKLSVLLYIGGVLWFMILAHKHFNAGTYSKATFLWEF